MCADIHDGREQNAPFKGRIQMRETNYLQISHIQLATHGRSIQMCQLQKWPGNTVPPGPTREVGQQATERRPVVSCQSFGTSGEGGTGRYEAIP